MEQTSLSVVVPVHNAEQTLAGRIDQLLEILPDLTTDFEVLVINDGSTDHTEEVAYELAREYPQIRVTRHDRRLGSRGAVETGLVETAGEVLFVQDDQAPIDSSKFHRLWELRNDEQIRSQPQLRTPQSVLQRLAAWGVRLEDATPGGGSGGVQMICRQTPEPQVTWTPIPSPVAGRRMRADAASTEGEVPAAGSRMGTPRTRRPLRKL